jgi:two-component system sensor histidine kinase TtrS
LLVNARALRRGGGRPDLILVAIDDVTERRRTQDLLHKAETRRREEECVRQRQLELTSAMRVSTVGELATGLAHELNQPLSSISNLVEASARHVRAGTVDPTKLLDLLSEVASEAVRAAGVVAHLRSFVDKGLPQFEPVDLSEIVNHVPQLLLRELDRNGVDLRIDVPTGELPVHADRIQIEQVIVNLLQNAMESIQEVEHPQRRIEMSARSVKGMGEVSVRDTGVGVSKLAAERMFEAFFTTKTEGLGMGLALSRSILEAHRGRIWMETPTDGGPGTVVRFSIPLKGKKRGRKARAA